MKALIRFGRIILTGVFVTGLCSGCATLPPRPAETAFGPPPALAQEEAADAIKNHFIQRGHKNLAEKVIEDSVGTPQRAYCKAIGLKDGSVGPWQGYAVPLKMRTDLLSILAASKASIRSAALLDGDEVWFVVSNEDFGMSRIYWYDSADPYTPR